MMQQNRVEKGAYETFIRKEGRLTMAKHIQGVHSILCFFRKFHNIFSLYTLGFSSVCKLHAGTLNGRLNNSAAAELAEFRKITTFQENTISNVIELCLMHDQLKITFLLIQVTGANNQELTQTARAVFYFRRTIKNTEEYIRSKTVKSITFLLFNETLQQIFKLTTNNIHPSERTNYFFDRRTA